MLAMILRCFLLLISTIILFTSTFLLPSLDRTVIVIGVVQMLASALAQAAALSGQFGYRNARKILLVYVLMAVSILVACWSSIGIAANRVLMVTNMLTSINILLSTVLLFTKDDNNQEPTQDADNDEKELVRNAVERC